MWDGKNGKILTAKGIIWQNKRIKAVCISELQINFISFNFNSDKIKKIITCM